MSVAFANARNIFNVAPGFTDIYVQNTLTFVREYIITYSNLYDIFSFRTTRALLFEATAKRRIDCSTTEMVVK